MSLPIEEFGRLIVARRGSRGVRSAAAEAGVSAATLSRLENGHMPDLATFAKLCKWLDLDPREFLGFGAAVTESHKAVVHFRKKKTVSKETARSLGELILSAQRAVHARSRLVAQ